MHDPFELRAVIHQPRSTHLRGPLQAVLLSTLSPTAIKLRRLIDCVPSDASRSVVSLSLSLDIRAAATPTAPQPLQFSCILLLALSPGPPEIDHWSVSQEKARTWHKAVKEDNGLRYSPSVFSRHILPSGERGANSSTLQAWASIRQGLISFLQISLRPHLLPIHFATLVTPFSTIIQTAIGCLATASLVLEIQILRCHE